MYVADKMSVLRGVPLPQGPSGCSLSRTFEHKLDPSSGRRAQMLRSLFLPYGQGRGKKYSLSVTIKDMFVTFK